jgi:hypothetical protein
MELTLELSGGGAVRLDDGLDLHAKHSRACEENDKRNNERNADSIE